MYHAHINRKNKEAKEKTYELIRVFVRRFKLLHGSIECKDLLKVDINSQEGRIYAKENNLFNTICQNLVKDSAEILEEIL